MRQMRGFGSSLVFSSSPVRVRPPVERAARAIALPPLRRAASDAPSSRRCAGDSALAQQHRRTRRARAHRFAPRSRTSPASRRVRRTFRSRRRRVRAGRPHRRRRRRFASSSRSIRGDDGFVRGNRRLPARRSSSPGSPTQYRYRVRAQRRSSRRVAIDSYDGGSATCSSSRRGARCTSSSSRPTARWDTFELADDEYHERSAPGDLRARRAARRRESRGVHRRVRALLPARTALYAGDSVGRGRYYGVRLEFCAGYSPSVRLLGSRSIRRTSASATPASGYATSFYTRGQYCYYDRLVRRLLPHGSAGGIRATTATAVSHRRHSAAGHSAVAPRGCSTPRDRRTPVTPTGRRPHALPVRRRAGPTTADATSPQVVAARIASAV